ncbi:molecular chaperone HtpG [Terrisporobacter glycolicus]|uniref:Chaperone protein HtpG n=1 Tax=Terrisporobacter glycolicus ATCC 14880 = DSM 1288 TaxID=1121315 RepID=A0ABZ2F0W5_9FIRM|nr:molecular chaperone HtpG [Terrisporobacter glycolicus]
MEITKGSISIDTENIFPIIKKWLYSDKDIFIRELISNGCDAVSKYKRLVSLGEVKNSQDEEYKITVSVSKNNKTIKFSDNGIGMTAEEVDKYINQVAFSGAEDFFNKYKDRMEETDIIGHFGLGFYSAFMVSKKVEIDTLSFQEGADPVRWISEGGTEFEISPSGTRATRGTTITLFLAEDSEEFLNEYEVRSIINKYCSFLPVEIYVEDEDAEVKEDEEKVEPTPLNDTNPLWLKSPKDCTDEEYKEFYRKVFNVFDEPLFWIHLNVDYPFNLKGILYFPKLNNEFELVEGKVKLYNNQVFVADNIKEVIPEFLLLLKGVIDCPDLPLNVSRSFLQNDRDVSKISKHIVKKVADKLKSLCKNNREEYEKFWDDIQIFIKFGCLKDEGFYDKVKDYILYKDIDGKYITLTDYLEAAKEKHENKVFYVNNLDQQSQYVKLFKDYGLNAVVLDSTIDNNFISFIEYKEMGTKFNRIDSDLSDVLKDKDSEENKEEDEKITSLFKSVINERVEKYSVESLKNEETPAMILVSEESRRMMEMQSRFAGMNFGMDLKEEKTLVINKSNPLVKKLVSLKDNEDKKEEIDVICNQIVDLALLANKELNAEELDLFIKRSNSLMSKVIAL